MVKSFLENQKENISLTQSIKNMLKFYLRDNNLEEENDKKDSNKLYLDLCEDIGKLEETKEIHIGKSFLSNFIFSALIYY